MNLSLEGHGSRSLVNTSKEALSEMKVQLLPMKVSMFEINSGGVAHKLYSCTCCASRPWNNQKAPNEWRKDETHSLKKKIQFSCHLFKNSDCLTLLTATKVCAVTVNL
jgi:hypothetical protein